MTHAVIDIIARKIVFTGSEDECDYYVNNSKRIAYLSIKTIEFARKMIGNS